MHVHAWIRSAKPPERLAAAYAGLTVNALMGMTIQAFAAMTVR